MCVKKTTRVHSGRLSTPFSTPIFRNLKFYQVNVSPIRFCHRRRRKASKVKNVKKIFQNWKQVAVLLSPTSFRVFGVFVVFAVTWFPSQDMKNYTMENFHFSRCRRQKEKEKMRPEVGEDERKVYHQDIEEKWAENGTKVKKTARWWGEKASSSVTSSKCLKAFNVKWFVSTVEVHPYDLWFRKGWMLLEMGESTLSTLIVGARWKFWKFSVEKEEMTLKSGKWKILTFFLPFAAWLLAAAAATRNLFQLLRDSHPPITL